MYFAGQKVDGKTVKRVERLRSGQWVYFTDGTLRIYR